MIGIIRLLRFRNTPILGYMLYETQYYKIFILSYETDDYRTEIRNIRVDDILQDFVPRLFSFWYKDFSMIAIQFSMDLL